jgi:hypothetical protein
MVPLEKQAITVVRQNKVGVDTTYEPPLRVRFGISDKTVDLAHAVMGRRIQKSLFFKDFFHVVPWRYNGRIQQSATSSACPRPAGGPPPHDVGPPPRSPCG